MSFHDDTIPDDNSISYQEKRAIVSLITTLVISPLYFWVVSQRFPTADAYSKEVFEFWGTVILILVPVSAVANVIIFVVFSVINTVATNEEEPLIVDERDQLIELRATRNAMLVFIIGFFFAIGLLAFNLPPSGMFIILILAGMFASMASDISQLYYYRRGV
jgi:hypothetical protein